MPIFAWKAVLLPKNHKNPILTIFEQQNIIIFPFVTDDEGEGIFFFFSSSSSSSSQRHKQKGETR